MMGQSLEPFDPYRMFVGEVPWTFLPEIAVRAILIYLALTIFIRIVGKRLSVYRAKKQRPGLPILPPERFRREMRSGHSYNRSVGQGRPNGRD